MYRIKLKKVNIFSSKDYCFKSELRYVIQKRYLFFFWLRIIQDGQYWSHATNKDAEESLQKHIQKLADNKSKKEHNKPTYYLVKDDKILSGNSEKEVIKKKKLIIFT